MLVSFQAGCFLPVLIVLNLFFGWMFLRPATWLLVGVILIALFLLNSYLVVRKIKSFSRSKDAIDVEGEVVEEKHRLHLPK